MREGERVRSTVGGRMEVRGNGGIFRAKSVNKGKIHKSDAIGSFSCFSRVFSPRARSITRIVRLVSRIHHKGRNHTPTPGLISAPDPES